MSGYQGATEDTRNQFGEKLRDGHYPLNVKFLMWQDSNLGKYIEFKIRVSYNEGEGNPHKSSTVSPTAAQQHQANDRDSGLRSNEWEVYKRYSNFIDLHDKLLPYFKAEGVVPPVIPPKIMNKKTTQMNQALTTRKNQLQAYLR